MKQHSLPAQIGVSSLRLLTAKRLRQATKVCIVAVHNDPVAAVIPYALYQEQQAQIRQFHQFEQERRSLRDDLREKGHQP